MHEMSVLVSVKLRVFQHVVLIYNNTNLSVITYLCTITYFLGVFLWLILTHSLTDWFHGVNNNNNKVRLIVRLEALSLINYSGRTIGQRLKLRKRRFNYELRQQLYII